MPIEMGHFYFSNMFSVRQIAPFLKAVLRAVGNIPIKHEVISK
jgi:hypothetical protein